MTNTKWLLVALLIACGSGDPDANADASLDGAWEDATQDGGTDAGPDSDASEPDAQTDAAVVDAPPDAAWIDALVADRPYLSFEPTNVPSGAQLPLIVTLHGLTSSGQVQANLFGHESRVDEYNFFLAAPDGTDYMGVPAWNIGLDGFDTDDVTYLRAVIQDMLRKHPIDPDRVYITGMSNGALMAHLMACEASDLVAAVAPVAGGFIAGAQTNCSPADPVGVLSIHGTLDVVVPYNGGAVNIPGAPEVLSALDTVQHWVTTHGCDAEPTVRDFNADSLILGDETEVQTYGGCQDDVVVEHWAIGLGNHISFTYSDAFEVGILDFLYAHTR